MVNIVRPVPVAERNQQNANNSPTNRPITFSALDIRPLLNEPDAKTRDPIAETSVLWYARVEDPCFTRGRVVLRFSRPVAAQWKTDNPANNTATTAISMCVTLIKHRYDNNDNIIKKKKFTRGITVMRTSIRQAQAKR